MNYQRLLGKANISMLITLLAFIATTSMAYGLESTLPLMLLVPLHISQLLFATCFKFSYVARLVAQYQLGLPIR